MKTAGPDPGTPKRPPRELSETEMRERIRKIRVDLEIYRLPSPERLDLLEKLAQSQDELLRLMSQRAMA